MELEQLTLLSITVRPKEKFPPIILSNIWPDLWEQYLCNNGSEEVILKQVLHS